MIRFRTVAEMLYGRIATIHPIWAIDEYAMIFRNWVWLRPPQPPTRIDVSATSVVIFVSSDAAIWHRMDIGASFCQVKRIIPDCNETPCVTSGTQKWNGDSPSFINRAMVINSEAVEFETFVIVHCPE